MGKVVQAAFEIAFTSLEAALHLMIVAYGLVAKSGDNALEAVQHQVKILRQSVNEAVDGIK